MAHKKTPLVIGNWKMNPQTPVEALALAKATLTAVKKVSSVRIGITPPLIYIPTISPLLRKATVLLGVQHVHPGPVGPYTGEVSPAMCLPYHVQFSIVGHSERRARGETDAMVNAAVLMLLKQKLTPVICVGERERDSQATFYSLVEAQVSAALAGVSAARYKDVVIAYEPIWAIGTGATATPADVQEMKLFIQKVLTKLSNRTAAAAVTIIYGGSVNALTARSLFVEGAVDGFLVGGASLKPDEFAKIVVSTIK